MELVFATACLSMIIAAAICLLIAYPLMSIGLVKGDLGDSVSIVLVFLALCIGSAVAGYLGWHVYPMFARTEIMADAAVFGSIFGAVLLPVGALGCGVYELLERRAETKKATDSSAASDFLP